MKILGLLGLETIGLLVVLASWVNPRLLRKESNMISRSNTLVKRAAYHCDSRFFPDGINSEKIDFSRSALEEFDGDEYVVLRSADDISAVFLVDESWQVERLPPERWPDDLLDESKLEEDQT